MAPFSVDGTSQTDNSLDGIDVKSNTVQQQRISRLHATLVETIAQGRQDRLAESRRVALSRLVSACLVITTTASYILLHRSGLVDLAIGRLPVGVLGLLWFGATFTETFARDTRRACGGLSLLCFVCWSFSHIIWRATSPETSGASGMGSSSTTGSPEGGGDIAAPAWVWVDAGVAWAIAPLVGGSLQLSLWGSIVPSWLSVTVALGYGLRAEEIALEGDEAGAAGGLLAGVAVCGLSVLAVGYQVLWEEARDARILMAVEDGKAEEDHRNRQARFSELLLRHLVTEPALKVLEAGIRELFNDARIFVMHSDALEQIQDGVSMLADYGEKALDRLRNGAPELPSPVLEQVDMEDILDACLRTTAYLAVSRDHHKVQLDMRVAPDVNKTVRTFHLWLSQMTRACLIHALHPDEDEKVILRVSYTRPGVLRVGVEAIWRTDTGGAKGGDDVDRTEDRRLLTGWDRDMPAAAWWVRAAALALGGEADYDRSAENPGSNELWFTIPAENLADEDIDEPGVPELEQDIAEPQPDLPEQQHQQETAVGGKDVLSRSLRKSLRNPRLGLGEFDVEDREGGSNAVRTTKGGGANGLLLPSVAALPGAGEAATTSTAAARLDPLLLPTRKRPSLEPLAHSAEVSRQQGYTLVTTFDGNDLVQEDMDAVERGSKGAGASPSITGGGGWGGVRLSESIDSVRHRKLNFVDEIPVPGAEGKQVQATEVTSRSEELHGRRPFTAPHQEAHAPRAGAGEASPPPRKSATSLSNSVRTVIGTVGELERLRQSLQSDGEAELARESFAEKGVVRRPGSAPTGMRKKASVFGNLVSNLVESNSMSWLSKTNSSVGILEERGPLNTEEEDSTSTGSKLEVLLVDPQGLVRWILPRLNEKKGRFSVTVAHTAEEGMELILSGGFEVAVIDLHMPTMSGVDFCRAFRGHEVSLGEAGVGGQGLLNGGGGAGLPASIVPEVRAKLLLHTTAAGSVKSDELEVFLEEGLVEKYVPQPLDATTLFDFLKLFEEHEDEHGTRKLSALLDEAQTLASHPSEAAGKASRLVRTLTSKASPTVDAPRTEGVVATARGGGGRAGHPGGKRWWSKRKMPPPSTGDMASAFFFCQGQERGRGE